MYDCEGVGSACDMALQCVQPRKLPDHRAFVNALPKKTAACARCSRAVPSCLVQLSLKSNIRTATMQGRAHSTAQSCDNRLHSTHAVHASHQAQSVCGRPRGACLPSVLARCDCLPAMQASKLSERYLPEGPAPPCTSSSGKPPLIEKMSNSLSCSDGTGASDACPCCVLPCLLASSCASSAHALAAASASAFLPRLCGAAPPFSDTCASTGSLALPGNLCDAERVAVGDAIVECCCSTGAGGASLLAASSCAESMLRAIDPLLFSACGPPRGVLAVSSPAAPGSNVPTRGGSLAVCDGMGLVGDAARALLAARLLSGRVRSSRCTLVPLQITGRASAAAKECPARQRAHSRADVPQAMSGIRHAYERAQWLVRMCAGQQTPRLCRQ